MKFNRGDKVILTIDPISTMTRLPRYLKSGTLTVIGETKSGNIICDWDGGNPFYIPESMLKRLTKEDL